MLLLFVGERRCITLTVVIAMKARLSGRRALDCVFLERWSEVTLPWFSAFRGEEVEQIQ